MTGKLIISTGDVSGPYEIIDAIFALDSHKESFFKGAANPDEAFAGVKRQLRERCFSMGGNAVINCQFEYRVATEQGFTGTEQVIEIFAYGTAIKII